MFTLLIQILIVAVPAVLILLVAFLWRRETIRNRRADRLQAILDSKNFEHNLKIAQSI